jgi:hypothetical protein
MTESASNMRTHSDAPSPAPTGDPAVPGPIPTKPLMSKRTRRATIIIGAIVVLVVLAVLVAIGYFMYTSYDGLAPGQVASTARLRDMAIVVLALETLLVMVLLLIIVVLMFVVIVLIYDRVIPILEQMNRTVTTVADTAHTVRGTTEFVSERVVGPVIEVSSYASGALGILREIRNLWPWRKRDGV